MRIFEKQRAVICPKSTLNFVQKLHTVIILLPNVDSFLIDIFILTRNCFVVFHQTVLLLAGNLCSKLH